MATFYNLPQLLTTRRDQASFHIASEPELRIQFFQMAANTQGTPLHTSGALIISCCTGEYELSIDSAPHLLLPGDHAVIPAGHRVDLRCHESGWLQFIWAPAFGSWALTSESGDAA